MTALNGLPFLKYHGAGNDFVCIDDLAGEFAKHETAETIALICDRRFGVGADGLLLLRSIDVDGRRLPHMVYYNSDGAPSSFCGNGARCFAKHVVESDFFNLDGPIRDFVFVAKDGIHRALVLGVEVLAITMHVASPVQRHAPEVDLVDTGSPHYVLWCEVLPEGDLIERAREVRYSPAFAKTGINVNYVVVESDGPQGSLRMRTYERGVEAETLSCGTGVTAAALSFAERQGITGQLHLNVAALGGKLVVHFIRSESGEITELYLEGPVQMVYAGCLA